MNSQQPSNNDVPRTKPQQPRRNPLWYVLQLIAKPLFTVWFRYRARGIEGIPQNGGALLVINHQSFLDPLLVGLPLARPVSYLARDSLFRVPLLGWLLRSTYVIPINRKSAASSSLRIAIDRLKQGFVVGIFPEGTRSEDGELGKLKPGFLAIVRRANVPVIPVGVSGSRESLPRHAWFVRPRRCCVVFGKPLAPAEIEQLWREKSQSEVVELIRDRMRDSLVSATAWRLRGIEQFPEMTHDQTDSGQDSAAKRPFGSKT